MIRSLYSGVSGMQQFQQEMDVIGNNIANVNTTAFKASRVEFADSFSQTYQASSAGDGVVSNTAALQVGTGVTTSAIRNLYDQGAVARTNVPTDLVVSGAGFFVVRDPVNNSQFVTRAGFFRLFERGRVITNTGLRVQGFADGGLSTVGDIVVDATGAPATSDPTATLISFRIDREGKVNVRLSDGTEFVRGQILMQNFRDPQSLVKEGANLYSGQTAAGPLAAASAPGSNGLGRIESGALELSNVDLANEFASLITTQRAFQASARIITTSDEMLQELVNLKR
jgi:flagellar hook protein FlgE